MSHTQLLLSDQARERILAGATHLVEAMRPTLGPRSKCVLIEKKYGSPIVCNDGVTIAKEVRLKDPQEDLGARMIREAAVRTGDLVGDGTTTSAILAHALYAEGLRNVVAGASAIELQRGMERGRKVAVEALAALARPAASRREREQIATISAHNDAEVGKLVADATERVGAEGVVSLEEAKGTETELEVVEGLQFDRGFLSPYFVTDVEKMEAVLEDPLVLVCDRKIGTMEPLLPVLEAVAKSGRPLLVVAEQVEGEALATLVVNKVRGTLRCAAAKAPGYGEQRRAMLDDIAVLTGATLVTEDIGIKLENLALADLGRCKRCVLDKETTTIVGGLGDKASIEGRCKELRRLIDRSTSDYEREKLEGRLAKLAGGVAVIRVGALSEAELKNRKEAFDDAIHATRAAAAEGVVPGGGVALLRLLPAVEAEEKRCSGDMVTGVRILRKALEAPARQIAENSGFDGGVVVEHLRASKGSQGFDAERGEYVDLSEAGILDPAKVVRVALESAVSVAGVLLLTEATLTEIEDPGDRPRAREMME
jgi:chaperonin GroEL